MIKGVLADGSAASLAAPRQSAAIFQVPLHFFDPIGSKNCTS